MRTLTEFPGKEGVSRARDGILDEDSGPRMKVDPTGDSKSPQERGGLSDREVSLGKGRGPLVSLPSPLPTADTSGKPWVDFWG